jgi:hypothetical protein
VGRPFATAVFAGLGQGVAVALLYAPGGIANDPSINAAWVTGTILLGLVVAVVLIFGINVATALVSQRNEARVDRDKALGNLVERERPDFTVEREESVPYGRRHGGKIIDKFGEIARLKVTNTGGNTGTFSASGVWIDSRNQEEQSSEWDACWIEGAELKVERRIFPDRAASIHLGLFSDVDEGMGMGPGLWLKPSRPGSVENRSFHNAHPIDADERLVVTVSRDDSPASRRVELRMFLDGEGNLEYEIVQLAAESGSGSVSAVGARH